ncbi:hypothetical protein [Streptomyces noursei]
MTDILIDADDEYVAPQLGTCKVRIGGTLYTITPAGDAAVEALLDAANDLLDAEKAATALYLCLSREDAREVRERLAASLADEAAADIDPDAVSRGKIRYTVQRLILHYQDDISGHFAAQAKRVLQPGTNTQRTAAPTRRPNTRKKAS